MKNKEESKPWRWWHVMILIIVILFSSFYALIQYPRDDEVGYVDPGAHLALVGRMISTAWNSNSPEVLWGSSNPGMPLMFAGWFKQFGFGKVQARLLFLALHFSGIFFLFRWIRNRFSPSPTSLLIGIISSLILPSLANVIFFCRLECLAFLLSAWFLHYSFSESTDFFNKFFSPFLLGVTIIFFGLHFIAFFSLAAIGIFLYNKLSQRSFLQGASLAVGIIVGLVLLRLTYGYYGIWDNFIAARTAHYGKAIPWVHSGFGHYTLNRDMVLFVLLSLVGLFSALFYNKERTEMAWLPWLIALGIFFIVPQMVNFMGLYYRSYAWMVAVPIMICFYFGESTLSGWIKKLFVSILFLGFFYFFGKATRLIPLIIKQIEYRELVIKEIQKISTPGSSVAIEFPFYYELYEKGYQVYPRVRTDEGLVLGFSQDCYLPAHIRNGICVAVTTENNKNAVLSGLGGQWQLYAVVPSNLKKEIQPDYQIFIRK